MKYPMTKSIAVKAWFTERAIRKARHKLGVPSETMVMSVKFNEKTKRWKVTFE